jgi:hypothetical protein
MFKKERAFQSTKKTEAAEHQKQTPRLTPVIRGLMDPGQGPSSSFFQGTYGNRATLRLFGEHIPARDYKLSRAGERSEQEADVKADEVLRISENELKAGTPAAEKSVAPPGRPDSSAIGPAAPSPGAFGGGSEPLPQDVRNFFEPRFGRDFSQVRIHRDGPANRTAEALHARALTFGDHMVFGNEQWSPGTGRGQRLLAHELAHVVQQGGSDPARHGTIFRAENNRDRSSFGSTLASAAATAVIAGMSSVAQSLTSTVLSDPANREQAYQMHLQIAILRLEAVAQRARNSLFGRAVTGKCLWIQATPLRLLPSFARTRWLPIVTHQAFDARYWSFEVNCDAGTAKLFQIRGKPSEAIDEMFDNLHLWTFDCAEYLQVAQWYAQRHTMGAEAFDKKMTGLGGLTLRPHGSTGIMTKEAYIRKGPYAPFYRENNVTMQTEPSDKMAYQLLDEAPVGTRITWTNTAAPTGSDPSRGWWPFGNENAIKMGNDQYAAHPFGTLSQADIECRIAAWGYVKEMEEAGKSSPYFRAVLLRKLIAECKAGRPRVEIHKYILDKIYVSKIEFFKLE